MISYFQDYVTVGAMIGLGLVLFLVFISVSALLSPKKPTPEKVKTYELTPGMAYAYQVGDLHSPHRTESTKLIRIEGMNMDGVQRDAYMVAS